MLRDKRSPKLFSTENCNLYPGLACCLRFLTVTDRLQLQLQNDMNPGPVPVCLEVVTHDQVEQILIAQGCPVNVGAKTMVLYVYQNSGRSVG